MTLLPPGTLWGLLGVLAACCLAEETCPSVKLIGIGDSDKMAILKGCPGLPGPPGIKGETGVTGVKGEPGIFGKLGPEGWKGETGAHGFTGDAGLTGSKGRKGDKGEPYSMPEGVPKNCRDLQKTGLFVTSWNTIYPDGQKPLVVLCDMQTDGGGWIVIQRRVDDSVDFYNDWETYKRGFGNQMSNFWLGNENIHRITSTGNFQLRVDLEDFEGNRTYAAYSDFKLEGEDQKYKLTFESFTGGSAGDSLSAHKNQAFTTKDKDSDASDNTNCAELYTAPWWHRKCFDSSLNGEYLRGNHSLSPKGRGVVWTEFRATPYSLKTSEMKIRPQT